MSFTTSFLDQFGNNTSPNSATLYVEYRSNGVASSVNVTMSSTANGWTASWNSAGADAGVCDWAIVAAGAVPVVLNGQIRVLANRATP